MTVLDWRVKTPTISGPMIGASVPWAAIWAIAAIAGIMFLVLSVFHDRITAVGISFLFGFVLWCLASVRTRQDRDWTSVLAEKALCKARMMALYLWNKYNFGWPT